MPEKPVVPVVGSRWHLMTKILVTGMETMIDG